MATARPRSLPCAQCGEIFEVGPRGALPKRCRTCRNPERPERPETFVCERCEGVFPVNRMGPMPRFCAECRLHTHGGHVRNVRLAEELAPLIDGSRLRLRIEAAKPLLRVALMRGSWDLVQAALIELEGHSDDLVLDIRKVAGYVDH